MCECNAGSSRNVFAANVVNLNDCAELYNYGRKASGLFKINPPSDGDDSKWYRAYCEEGWTDIARRSQNFDDAVSKKRYTFYRLRE